MGKLKLILHCFYSKNTFTYFVFSILVLKNSVFNQRRTPQHNQLIIYLSLLSRAHHTALTCRLDNLGRDKPGLLPRVRPAGHRCLEAEMTQ